LQKGGRGGDRRKKGKFLQRCDECKKTASFEKAVQPVVAYPSS